MASISYRKIKRTLKRHGLVRSLHLCVFNVWYYTKEFTPSRRRFRAAEKEFDRRFGLDTCGDTGLSELEIEGDNYSDGNMYQATPPDIFHEMMRSLCIKYEDFVFIDFGSRKARALVMASDYPFKQVVGVEFSHQLNQVALENIYHYQSETQKCRNIESICMDAAGYAIPQERTVCYFYNPFGERVMARVLANIQKSLQDCPREVLFLFNNPQLCHLLDQSSFLEKVKSTQRYRIYSGKLRENKSCV